MVSGWHRVLQGACQIHSPVTRRLRPVLSRSFQRSEPVRLPGFCVTVTDALAQPPERILATRSGFAGVIDLLKTAKHGKSENVYLIRFRYLPPSDGIQVG
jgi:hypothetical protein